MAKNLVFISNQFVPHFVMRNIIQRQAVVDPYCLYRFYLMKDIHIFLFHTKRPVVKVFLLLFFNSLFLREVLADGDRNGSTNLGLFKILFLCVCVYRW